VSEADATGSHALAALNLQADDFTLFGLSPGFQLDRLLLDERWKQLQRQAHPDRYTTQGAAAQRLAMQWSVRINEAYQRLKDPLKRATYWCERAGVPVNAENNTAMPAEFLMQQMAWRERLDEVASEAELDALLQETQQARQRLLDELQHQIDGCQDARAAVSAVRALMFVERFAEEIQRRLERF